MQSVEFDNLLQFPLKELSQENKVLLLKELGFSSDGIYVLDETGQQIVDKYLGVPIKIENMLILPGSTIILDDNELSITLYLEEYSNVLG